MVAALLSLEHHQLRSTFAQRSISPLPSFNVVEGEVEPFVALPLFGIAVRMLRYIGFRTVYLFCTYIYQIITFLPYCLLSQNSGPYFQNPRKFLHNNAKSVPHNSFSVFLSPIHPPFPSTMPNSLCTSIAPKKIRPRGLENGQGV